MRMKGFSLDSLAFPNECHPRVSLALLLGNPFYRLSALPTAAMNCVRKGFLQICLIMTSLEPLPRNVMEPETTTLPRYKIELAGIPDQSRNVPEVMVATVPIPQAFAMGQKGLSENGCGSNKTHEQDMKTENLSSIPPPPEPNQAARPAKIDQSLRNTVPTSAAKVPI